MSPITNPELPVAGELNSTADPKILNALYELLAVVNSNIDAANLAAASVTPEKLALAAKQLSPQLATPRTVTMLGPYTFPVSIGLGGASTIKTYIHFLNTTDYHVLGALRGVANDERVTWAYEPKVNEVEFRFHAHDLSTDFDMVFWIVRSTMTTVTVS